MNESDDLPAILDVDQPPSSVRVVDRRHRRLWPTLIVTLMVLTVVAAVAAIAGGTSDDQRERPDCNRGDLFEEGNANVVVELTAAMNIDQMVRGLHQRSFNVGEIIVLPHDGSRPLVAHVRFGSDAVDQDVDTFIDNARLLPWVKSAVLGSCSIE